MNKKYILLGILTATALAVYSINRKYRKNNNPILGGGQPNNLNQGQSGTFPKPTMGGGVSNINTEPKTNTGTKIDCPSGYTLVALDPLKPNVKTCIPTPKQDTRVPIKCPFGLKLVDGKCVGSTSGELGGGGGGGLPPKERDERPTTNQSEYTDTESTLVFDDNSPNRY
jgi:hypothetical protein